MKRRSQPVGVLLLLMLLMAAVATCAQSGKPKAPKEPPPPRNEVRPRGAAKSSAARNPEGPMPGGAPLNTGGAAPKAGGAVPKDGGAPRLGAPGNPVERLMAMPPEKRDQVLERLPPRQQANLRQRLDRFDKLPAAERARLNRMWSTFNSLPPEKQAIVTRQILAFNGLPEARRTDLKPVLQRLRLMPEDRRNALLNSEAFKNRFSASELQMLTDISQNYPLPGR